jgi:two-component system response regulator AtoC
VAISEKSLREDLYYRLNTFVVTVPPLRERREEIPYLLKHFMTRFAGEWGTAPMAISDSLLNECLRYRWPGNIRELENFVKRSLVLRDEPFVIAELKNATVAHSEIAATRADAEHLKSRARSAKQEAEISAIKEALETTRWNRKRAAGLLNISYATILYKIREYEIEQSTWVA